MPEITLCDYSYGDETTAHFTFFKIPRQLITNPRFKRLSTDAKLLYGIMLDCMGLSARNGWYDDTGQVYIYYTMTKGFPKQGTSSQKRKPNVRQS